MVNRKGQAAMEFLMTYGWAILVVLVAIGALAYFGVLNPSRFLPRSCTIGPGFGCDDFKVTATTVQLIMRNGLGDDLADLDVVVLSCTKDVNADGNPVGGADDWVEGTLLGGADGITLTACPAAAVGSKFKEDVVINYQTSSGITHAVTGTVTTQVE